MKQKRNKKKLNGFKKSIRKFIKDEEGFIEKDKIIKIGLGTISALTVASSLLAPKTACAAHSSTPGPDENYLAQESVPGTHCTKMVNKTRATHQSHDSGK